LGTTCDLGVVKVLTEILHTSYHIWAHGPPDSGGPEARLFAGGRRAGGPEGFELAGEPEARRTLGEPEGSGWVGGPEGRPPTALRSAFIIDSFQRNKIKIITCTVCCVLCV